MHTPACTLRWKRSGLSRLKTFCDDACFEFRSPSQESSRQTSIPRASILKCLAKPETPDPMLLSSCRTSILKPTFSVVPQPHFWNLDVDAGAFQCFPSAGSVCAAQNLQRGVRFVGSFLFVLDLSGFSLCLHKYAQVAFDGCMLR